MRFVKTSSWNCAPLVHVAGQHLSQKVCFFFIFHSIKSQFYPFYLTRAFRKGCLSEDAGVCAALSLPLPTQVSCYYRAGSIDFIWPCADRLGPCSSWQRRVAGQLTASRDFLLSFKHYPFTKLLSPEIHTSPFSNDDLKSNAWKIDPSTPSHPATPPQPLLLPLCPHACFRLAVRAAFRSKMVVG